MTHRWCLHVAILLGLVLPDPAVLAAQSLQGRLLDETSGAPLRDALVQLLGDRGDEPVAGAPASSSGRFRLGPVAPGRRRLRVLRIGLAPWTSGELTLAAGQVLDSTFRVPAIPVELAEIVVESDNPCRARPAEDRRMALLWDEARTALGLAGASSRRALLFHTVLTRRVLGPDRDRVTAEERSSATGRGTWPVLSQEADSLAALGFVQAGDTVTGPVYFGPDARVFFSESFLRTHCFRLVPSPAGEPNRLGLGFEPVDRRGRRDIEGVLWVDRRGGLIRLEYRYTGLWRWIPPGVAGGALEFGRLRGGEPIITGWTIRAPVAGRERWPAGIRRDTETEPFFGHGRIVLHGFKEEVGQVDWVRSAGGTVLWRRGEADSPPKGRIPSSRES